MNTIEDIIDAVHNDRVNITHHARQEAKNDSLFLDDILYATCNGEIIEDYPTDTPNPSCLIYGNFLDGSPIHCVWAYDSETRVRDFIRRYQSGISLC